MALEIRIARTESEAARIPAVRAGGGANHRGNLSDWVLLKDNHITGIGITTYYRWKALRENPISNEQLRVSELESENGRLKLLVAELALGRRMLREALKKKP